MSEAPVTSQVASGMLHIDAPTGPYRASLLGSVEVVEIPVDAIKDFARIVVSINDPESVKSQIEQAQIQQGEN